ncbi:hypothetical protein PMZ80_003191 [Knufia obscura]|uniref:Glycine zipper 2TM domain-containing protein n=1 Tax=Knufia obscura TaxID=1635080 RepID=A0ABR0RUI2_9EURO|nr:hypothetical protein PMZ80_003191 [Knufia obscura]
MSNQNYYSSDYPSRPDGRYHGAPQQIYGNAYSTYEPPRNDGYRHDMAVARYDEEQNRYEYDRRYPVRGRNHDEYHNDRRAGYHDEGYSPEPRRSSSRPRSRGMPEEEHKKKDHHRGKDVGATLLGGAVGAFAGHELGHNGIASTIGALVGAYGGHELEKRHEKKKEKRDSGVEEYSKRSISRSRSRRRDDYDDDDDYDNARRRDNRHYRDSDRYD